MIKHKGGHARVASGARERRRRQTAARRRRPRQALRRTWAAKTTARTVARHDRRSPAAARHSPKRNSWQSNNPKVDSEPLYPSPNKVPFFCNRNLNVLIDFHHLFLAVFKKALILVTVFIKN